jgi:hypothetical protein
MLEDAVAIYLADPDRDLPMDELLYKLMKGRVEQKAKVFTQTCGKNTDLKLEELQEKLARIDIYGSNEFVFTGAVTDTGNRNCTSTFISMNMLNLQANTTRSQKQSTNTSRDIKTINQGVQEFLSN